MRDVGTIEVGCEERTRLVATQTKHLVESIGVARYRHGVLRCHPEMDVNIRREWRHGPQDAFVGAARDSSHMPPKSTCVLFASSGDFLCIF